MMLCPSVPATPWNGQEGGARMYAVRIDTTAQVAESDGTLISCLVSWLLRLMPFGQPADLRSRSIRYDSVPLARYTPSLSLKRDRYGRSCVQAVSVDPDVRDQSGSQQPDHDGFGLSGTVQAHRTSSKGARPLPTRLGPESAACTATGSESAYYPNQYHLQVSKKRSEYVHQLKLRFYREDFHPAPGTGPTRPRQGTPHCKCGIPT